MDVAAVGTGVSTPGMHAAAVLALRLAVGIGTAPAPGTILQIARFDFLYCWMTAR
jgi:hypothetical protein